jgi:hypothetical protein
MLKKLVPVLAATALLAAAAAPSVQAFDIGGAGGWQFSTDGIVDVFAVYQTASPLPSGDRTFSFLNQSPDYNQEFGVTVGLLPCAVGFNVKAPTVNGVDSSVRIGIYPSIQNSGASGSHRFDVTPNVDFREMNYTAKGKYGELLAGRALNLYQGKNILTDMTLLTVGVVPTPGTSTTLGHIGYGYLYTNFGPQLRYTTPELGGAKVALSVNTPYKISADTAKTPTPRVETEISWARTFDSTTLQAWASGMYQSATRSKVAGTARPGGQDLSLGGAAGVQAGFGGLDLLASGYYGEGLGMISVQDGDEFGSSSTDAAGENRNQYGFLLQATYKLTPDIKLGANYGQTRQDKSSADKTIAFVSVPMSKQESASTMVTYNFNKFTQFVVEYTYAQNTWMDSAKQHANSLSVGTMFYW